MYTEYSTLDYDAMNLILLCERENLQAFVSSYIATVLYLMFILSITGNSLTLFILLKWEKINSVTNVFILNLIISDLIFSITLPFTAVDYSSSWIFGNLLCKVTTGFFFIGFQSFITFLTLMTIDQYLIVVHSWSSSSRLKVRCAVYVSITVWITSIIFSIPDVLISETRSNESGETTCEASHYSFAETGWWISLGHYKHFVLFFFFPMCIIFFCYVGIIVKITKSNIRRKGKVLKLIFFIVLFFFLCWSPYNIIMFLMFQEQIQSFKDCNIPLQYLFYIFQTIVYSHCCMNPFLYAFLGTKFRRHLSCSSRHCFPRRLPQDLSLKTSL
ncbi:chemokine XC receptor 1-like [Discoglossus pictus]